MPAIDFIHPTVRAALEKDGWKIINDPLFIPVEGLSGLFIDLAAQHILEAERDGEKIAVEIKGFGEQSLTHDFYLALGQVLVYKHAMAEQGLDWPLFLAMPTQEFSRLEKVPLFIQLLDKFTINLLIVDIENQSITSWHTPKNMNP
ncbi:MAG: element excision factor XisH family protein [Saprospiraceae bacterium]